MSFDKGQQQQQWTAVEKSVTKKLRNIKGTRFVAFFFFLTITTAASAFVVLLATPYSRKLTFPKLNFTLELPFVPKRLSADKGRRV